MKVSQTIREKLLNDKEFRLSAALALGVGEGNIRKLALTGSDNLTKYAAVQFYRSEGFTDEQIFEDETVNESR